MKTIIIVIALMGPLVSQANVCSETVSVSLNCSTTTPTQIDPLKIESFEAVYQLVSKKRIRGGKWLCNYKSDDWSLDFDFLYNESEAQVVGSALVTDVNHLDSILDITTGLSANELRWVKMNRGIPILSYSTHTSYSHPSSIAFTIGLGSVGRDQYSTYSYPSPQISAGEQLGGRFRTLRLATTCKGKSSLGDLDEILLSQGR